MSRSSSEALPTRPGGRLADRARESLRALIEVGRAGSVKKLFILVLVGLCGLAVWRRIQAQRADLDLWSEATTPDEY